MKNVFSQNANENNNIINNMKEYLGEKKLDNITSTFDGIAVLAIAFTYGTRMTEDIILVVRSILS